MDQPAFLTLSPELIFLVCETLRLTDLKQLRLSCKAISRITDSLVLRHLSISAEGAPLEEAILYLQSLAQSPARYITQEIVIRDLSSLSPGISPSNANDSTKDVREKMKEALESMTRVHHVTWHPNEKDHLRLQKTIWNIIQSFSAMRHLSIDAQFLKFLPNFDALKCLDSISIDASTCSQTSWIYTRLSKLYASSSTLTSLSIWDASRLEVLTKPNNVNQIFSRRPKHTSHSGLRRLNLHDCFISINKLTLPHLRQLTSLELLCRKHRYSDWDSTSYGHPRDIWSTFTGSGIRFEELVHNTTPPSLIDYLSSYDGLKKLNLNVSPFRSRSSSDETATRFFETVLPRHFDTLENLGLEAYYEGKWCYSLRNEASIMQCTKLNRLLISLISSFTAGSDEGQDGDDYDDIEGEGDVGRSGKRRNMVKRVLDRTICLPLLSHLSLLPAYPESSRGNRCGTRRVNHRHGSQIEIMKKVQNYRPPVSCRYMPEVEVCEKKFEVVRGPDCQLSYIGLTEGA